MVIRYLMGRVTNYLERKEAERFDRFMGEIRTEASRILSKGKFVRKMHANPDAWRLVY
jgi:hypothetical protein